MMMGTSDARSAGTGTVSNATITIVVTIFLAAVLVGVKIQPWLADHYLMRDPLASAGHIFKRAIEGRGAASCCSPFLGIVSNLGGMLWFIGAGICVFAAQLLRGKAPGEAKFLNFAGAFTFLLGIDDLFMLHEDVLPSIGVPENLFYAVLVAIGLLYLMAAYKRLFTYRGPLLLTALALLGLSFGLDLVATGVGFAEDALKFGGIGFWTAFHTVYAFDLLSPT